KRLELASLPSAEWECCTSQRMETVERRVDGLSEAVLQKLCSTGKAWANLRAIHFDAETAHPKLEVSSDMLEVRWSKQASQEKGDGEHISAEYNVLARESFSSGAPYWEVVIWEKPYWLIGLSYGPSTTSAETDAVMSRSSSYEAFCYIYHGNGKYLVGNGSEETLLPVRKRIKKLGVWVNFQRGTVSFHDADTLTLLYSFSVEFLGPVYPVFNPCMAVDEQNTQPLVLFYLEDQKEGRSAFDFGQRETARWFPGHMAKGLKQMRARLRSTDCIIEIHDARISFERHPSVLKQLEREGVKNVLFTDCLKQRDDSVKKIVPLVTKLIENAARFHREENRSYCLMVIGVPNVGKSSLINALRRTNLKKGKASRVGGEPGITKAILTKIQVCERPIIHLLDTPGVLPPNIENIETGMKLALCGTILDHLVGEDVIADYLLFSLNRLQQFGYVERYDLEAPCDDIQHVLKHIAVKLGKTQRVKAITGVGDITMKVPNYTAAAYDFIRAFRKGELGKVMLDL
ncbi:hypothetical protein P4O66_013811, partial [Electrophorus voltai]